MEEAVFRLKNGGYLYMQDSSEEDGYDYTIYDECGVDVDGGIIESDSFQTAIAWIQCDHNIEVTNNTVDVESFLELTTSVFMSALDARCGREQRLNGRTESISLQEGRGNRVYCP